VDVLTGKHLPPLLNIANSENNMSEITKIINGKIYHYYGSVETENMAIYHVDSIRSRGFYARYFKVATFPGHIYQIWEREKEQKGAKC
jgi:hypothetical protein